MNRGNGFVVVPRWLLLALASILVLGHLCDLTIYADAAIASSLIDAVEHAAHGGSHDHKVSCDPVDALVSAGAGGAAPMWAVAQVVTVGNSSPIPLVAVSVLEPRRPPDRPPLFLLHASLLI